jgi:transposase InsO family protein
MGTPNTVLTYQGTKFISEISKNVCKMLKVKKLLTTPFHTEGNGSLERCHRVMKEYLRHYIRDQRNWEEWVPYTV